MTKSVSIACCGAALLLLCACSGQFPTDTSKLQAAEARFDATLLTTSLNQIEAWHEKNDTGVARILRPGKSEVSIEEAFTGSDCQPTNELRALWSWHDGGVGPTPFAWYHDFLPLEEALSEYKWLRMNPLVRWDPHYIPILSFEGEWYGAYCGPKAGSAGPIAHYFLEDGGRIVSVNLTVFVAGMAEAFESGAIQWKNDGMVEDIQQVYSIHQRNNPGYEFPYYVATGN